MDYEKFFAEIAAWIQSVNQVATAHGMDSDPFWEYVMTSAKDICEKYNNNDLVMKQMVMLYAWLEDVYAQMSGVKL